MLLEKVREAIREYGMFGRGERVVVGLSGGADSVCLLRVLCELRQEQELWIGAVHVHHGIRGAEADGDAQFAEELCGRLSVPFVLEKRNVPALAAECQRSEEEMGRIARYGAFEEWRQKWGCGRVAVAHNRDDNAETLLWNLCRGTGLAGLAGIRPVSGAVVRPLLFVGRAEIEGYLAGLGQDFCVDRTNLEGDYTRNRIRNVVLPLLAGEVNTQAILHMSETAGRMRAAVDFMEAQAEAAFDGIVAYSREKEGQAGEVLLWREQDFNACPAALRAMVLLRALKLISGKAGNFTAKHVQALEELFGKGVGKRVCLPYRVRAVRTYEGVRIFKEEGSRDSVRENKDRGTAVCIQAPIPGEVSLPGMRLSFRVWDCTEGGKRRIEGVSGGEIQFSDGEFVKIPESSCTKWFDYDRIFNTVDIRTRRPGDEIVLHPEGGRKKLKSYWIDRKLPQEERDRQLLLAEGSRILWILGDRTGESYRILARTVNILVVQIEDGGKQDGR